MVWLLFLANSAKCSGCRMEIYSISKVSVGQNDGNVMLLLFWEKMTTGRGHAPLAGSSCEVQKIHGEEYSWKMLEERMREAAEEETGSREGLTF